MTKALEPMLAWALKGGDKLTFPLLASPKLDGIRCILPAGGAPHTRTGAPVPNGLVRERLSSLKAPIALDGELIVPGLDFSATQSFVMSAAGSGDFRYCVFDAPVPGAPFVKRHEMLVDEIAPCLPDWACVVTSLLIEGQSELAAYEEECLDRGYEGVMLRRPASLYKHGRSTLAGANLLKLKRFKDSEAVVIGVSELVDARGVRRSELGALTMTWPEAREPFAVGSGFTQAQRVELWRDRDKLIGKVATVQYQELTATGRPRFPVFKGFRPELEGKD